jgi:hypothetical protein
MDNAECAARDAPGDAKDSGKHATYNNSGHTANLGGPLGRLFVWASLCRSLESPQQDIPF